MSRRRSSTTLRDVPGSRPPASRRTSDARTIDHPAESWPIDEIAARYPGEWVAVKVTALDERHSIARGEVLAHSNSLTKVSGVLRRAHREDPTIHTYLFAGGAAPATIEEWRAALAEAAGKIKDYKDYLYAGR